jgi:DNA-binding NarL/FixJ family response regulator
VSFDRTDARTERSRTIAQLLAPAFEAGVLTLLQRIPIQDPDGLLTPREREVAELLVRRRMNHEIAASLGLSEHTVRHHIENIFSKLGVRSRHDVAGRLRVRR